MLEKWITNLDELTEQYLQTFSELTSEQLNIKPNENAWSVGQCIDHVIVTNEQYFRIIRQINEGAYQSHWMSKIPLMPKLFGKTILKSVSPETINKKSKTFKVFEPTTSEVKDDVLSRFNMMQLQLKSYISEVKPSNYSRIISSPVSDFVVYSLQTAFEIIIAHEGRHYLQALEVKELIFENI